MTTTVYRYVTHTIRRLPDCTITAQAHCLAPDRGAESGEQVSAEALNRWALDHTRRTGHSVFRRMVTDAAQVSREG